MMLQFFGLVPKGGFCAQRGCYTQKGYLTQMGIVPKWVLRPDGDRAQKGYLAQ